MRKLPPLPVTWDLEVIFPGGSESKEFAAFLATLDQDIARYGESVRSRKDGTLSADALQALAEGLQSIQSRLIEAESFASCLAAANQKDKKAVTLGSAIRSLAAAFESALTFLDQWLAEVPEEEWQAWMKRDAFRAVAFPLSERRKLAGEKLRPEQEALLNDLAVDGYHGWSELYDTTVSAIEIPYEEDGKTELLSVGQAQNKLYHPVRNVRLRTFAQWERTWEKHADYCAQALNHLGGFRLQMYKHRGWQSVLKEPLEMNRMSEATLAGMWEAIEQNRSFLLDYFRKKADLLGVAQLGWTDVEAPLGKAGEKVRYDDGAALIVDQFRRFGSRLADFAETAFQSGWIESEDRAGKRPGGFCTSLPLKRQSRIFMTYDGSMTNVSTLAHELGHAFHSHVMFDQPQLTQNYAMGVAETASTFAELIVSDAMIRNAADRETKLALLDDKIQRSVAFLMNIHARFLFEVNFYEERKQGTVGSERLNALMEAAQRKAYLDSLQSYHPHFWASKLHFYITEVPFYNFPYTFGYLFSTGIYAAAAAEGAGFEDRYIALLQDTGRMTVEELAHKHLAVDLTKPDFWKQSILLMKRDVEDFLAL